MRRRKRAQLKREQEDLVDLWNSTQAIGARVRYWRGIREGDGKESVTRSAAWLLGEQACVMIEGTSGGIALSHVEVIS